MMPNMQTTPILALLVLIANEVQSSLHPTSSPTNNNTFVCGSTRNFTGVSGIIKSPGYPVRYPSNLYCTYDINVEWGNRVELEWKDFDVDGNMPDCNSANGDYVEVYTGCGYKKQFLTRFCTRNSAIPHSVYSVDNCMSLRLFTKPEELAKISKGFFAEYRAVNKSRILNDQKCNRTLTESAGIMHSTFWPQTYMFERWDKCNWYLNTDQTMAVKFTFMDLDTYSGYYGSCNDGYGIHDGIIIQGIGSLYRSKKSWKEFSGSCKPLSYKSLYNQLVINWRIMSSSYYTHRLRGFILGYVVYRPVDRNMAAWQYALLASAAAVTISVSLLFSYRHAKLQRSMKRYRRFVNVGTGTDDMQTEQVDGEGGDGAQGQGEERRTMQDAEIDTQDFEQPDQSERLSNHCRNDSRADLSSCGTDLGITDAFRMSNFADVGTGNTSQDYVPRNTNTVEVIFHPLPPTSIATLTAPYPLPEYAPPHPVPPADRRGDTLQQESDQPISQSFEGLSNWQPKDQHHKGQLNVHSPQILEGLRGDRPNVPDDVSVRGLSNRQSVENRPGHTGEETPQVRAAASDEERLDMATGWATALESTLEQEPSGKYNFAYVDDEMPRNGSDSTFIYDRGRALSQDSGHDSHANSQMAPPPYEEIYDELQTLSRMVAEIISDIE